MNWGQGVRPQGMLLVYGRPYEGLTPCPQFIHTFYARGYALSALPRLSDLYFSGTVAEGIPAYAELVEHAQK